jgi:antirestriction protein
MELNQITIPAVLVTTFRDYNNGNPFGTWMNPARYDSEARFKTACTSMHGVSPDAELMIIEAEGIPSQFYAETGITWHFIDAFRQAEEEGTLAPLMAWYRAGGDGGYSDFEAAYVCEAASAEDYARDLLENNGALEGLAPQLREYFDFEAYGRDLMLNGMRFEGGFVFNRI